MLDTSMAVSKASREVSYGRGFPPIATEEPAIHTDGVLHGVPDILAIESSSSAHRKINRNLAAVCFDSSFNLWAAKPLKGVRGRAPIDVRELSELVSRAIWLAADHRVCLLKTDVNAVLARPNGDGCIAVDVGR